MTVDVDCERIEELIALAIANKMVESREVKMGVRDGVDKAIQKHIYARKEDIIERLIERATAEVVRKGIPKLIESLAQKAD